MSKKHLIRLAKTYRALLMRTAGTFAYAGVVDTLESLLPILAEANPRFDETRFRAACGLANLPMIGGK